MNDNNIHTKYYIMCSAIAHTVTLANGRYRWRHSQVLREVKIGRKSSSFHSKLAHDRNAAKDLFLTRGLRECCRRFQSERGFKIHQAKLIAKGRWRNSVLVQLCIQVKRRTIPDRIHTTVPSAFEFPASERTSTR